MNPAILMGTPIDEVRRCANELCRKRLSRYNKADKCFVCQEADAEAFLEREAAEFEREEVWRGYSGA